MSGIWPSERIYNSKIDELRKLKDSGELGIRDYIAAITQKNRQNTSRTSGLDIIELGFIAVIVGSIVYGLKMFR